MRRPSSPQLAAKGKLIGRKALRDVGSLVTPLAILRWYRTLVAKKYDGSNKRRPGRPRTRQRIRELTITMAESNPTWGCTRIRDALRNVGHVVGRNTIRRLLAESGIEPAPQPSAAQCSQRMPWRTFLKAHVGAIAATDFFTAEVLTLVGLVRYHVLFVIDISTRRVHVAGIVHEPQRLGGLLKCYYRPAA